MLTPTDLDEFVLYLRDLLSQVPQPSEEVYNLYHFTADWQRQEIEWLREANAAMYELKLACIERFGRIPYPHDSYPPWPSAELQVLDRTAGAAQLLLQGPDHPDHVWHLILVDGRWRIDAERMIDPTPADLPPDRVEMRERFRADVNRMSQRYKMMAQKIRRGELTWEQISSH